ncbi:MAG: shikimate dehydrogenase [Gemmatimonadota bacterium]
MFAVLGDPVAHSLSPQLQNAAFTDSGIDAVYVALHCDADRLPGLMRGITAARGGGNVTLPHKALARRTIERATEAVERTGACNTFWCDGGALWGDNTDVVGVRRSVASLLEQDAKDARVLLLGAGGAARAAMYAFISDRAGEVVVLNRSAHRARDLIARFEPAPTRLRLAPSIGSLANESFDLVVNATSLGLRPDDPLPLPLDAPLHVAAALDLVYTPDGTAWCRAHSSRGTPAADGIEMLLYQGAAAFERWTGVDAPLAAMRDALPPR